ncbi:MAG: ribonuclease VapC [Nitrospirales bacterium]|nr:MAG: ribonuclease VapC [Nitrospirales bacterium]
MYLIDTNVISEARKGRLANIGVQTFFQSVTNPHTPVYLSVMSIGELRRGLEKIRYRGDRKQAVELEKWVKKVLTHYQDYILDFDDEAAQVWGHLRVPNSEHALDKQIAATALVYDLTVVTRNTKDFKTCGVKLYNPFTTKK